MPNKEMKHFPGFLVCDAETREPITPEDYCRSLYGNRTGYIRPESRFAMTSDGKLIIYVPYESDTEVKKKGKYIIQFGTGSHMRW